MIRIFHTHEQDAIRITVDGRLVGEYVDAVKTCAQQAAAQKKTVYVFLRSVSHIDAAGLTLLSQLAAKGVQLSASGLYSSYVVEEIRRKQKKLIGT